jgi:hypothetical protein
MGAGESENPLGTTTGTGDSENPLGTTTGTGESETPLGTVIGIGVTTRKVDGKTVLVVAMAVALVSRDGAKMTMPGDTGFIDESLGMGRFASPGIDVVGPSPTPGPKPNVGPAGDTVVVVTVVVVVVTVPPPASAAVAYRPPAPANSPIIRIFIGQSPLSKRTATEVPASGRSGERATLAAAATRRPESFSA